MFYHSKIFDEQPDNHDIMTMPTYTAEDILLQLDMCAASYNFPMLDNGYIYLAGVQLSAYRNSAYWAIVIEVIGINNRLYRYDRFENCLYCFGNCLYEAPGIQNSRLVLPIPEQDNIFEPEQNWFIRSDARSIIIRDKNVAIPTEAEIQLQGILPEVSGKISIVELLRALFPVFRPLFLATDRELRAHIPQDIPCILQLSAWRHPDLVHEKPSDLRTFRTLAEVLVHGHAEKFNDPSPPNTHWSRWPMGGAL